jgi:hypothetical protein
LLSVRNGVRASLLAALSVSVLGCETGLDVVVFNDLREPVSVSVGAHTVTADPGQSGRLGYPDPKGVELGRLTIVAGGCTMTYEVPAVLDDYPWRAKVKGVVPFQLEADWKLYAIPPDSATALPLSDAARLQKGSFPLSPSKRACR